MQFGISEFQVQSISEKVEYTLTENIRLSNVEKLWELGYDGEGMHIAVLDTGCDVSHKCLKDRIVETKNFINGSDDVTDRNGHGTHVAGIIAAKHNNGVGISGICDNSKLIGVDWYPYLIPLWNTELAIYFGLSNCVKAGAKVVNFSLGTSSSSEGVYMSAMDESITPAAVSYMMASLLSKGYDFVAVQSAGNGDVNGDIDAGGSVTVEGDYNG